MSSEQETVSYQVLIFLVLVAGIIFSGYLYYQIYEQEFRSGVEDQLTSIGDLKVNELAGWWNERLGDADLLYHNPVFSSIIREMEQNPQDFRANGTIHAWLSIIQSHYRYDRIFLLNPEGEMLMATPDMPEPVSSVILGNISQVLRTGEVTLIDFYRSEYDQKVYLTILIPIVDREMNNRILGIIGLQIDPEEYLYPFIRKWPVASSTAETLLVRREGDSVLYLNELRLRPGIPLSLRFPLNMTDLPAVMAVTGREGIVEGSDYQGQPTIAYIHAIPDTPWFMVARISRSEVYQPLQRTAIGLSFIMLLIIATTGGALFFLRQRERWGYYRKQYEMERALRESEKRYQDLVNLIPISVFETDKEGYFTFFNTHAYTTYQYTPEDLAEGLHYTRMVIPEEKDRAKVRAERLSYGEVLTQGQEYHCQRKDGSIVPAGIVSAPIIQDGVIVGIRGAAIDLTETLTEKEKFSHVFYDSLSIMALSLLSTDRFLDINHAFETHLGYTREEVIGKTSAELGLYTDSSQRQHLTESMQAGIPIKDYEVRIRKKDGTILTLLFSGDYMTISGEEIFFTQGVDITVLKDVQQELAKKNDELAASFEELTTQEEELRHQYDALTVSEENLKQTTGYLENLISYANVPIIIWDPDLSITRINHACENLIGRLQEEVVGKSLDILFPPDRLTYSKRLLEVTHAGVRWDTVELDIVHKDGSLKTVIWNSSTIYSADGLTPVATISQGQDITLRRRLERENEVAVMQIQKNLAQFSILNDGIRNPLMVILSAVDLSDESRLNDTITEEVRLIDEIVTQLDQRWFESEKILSMLRKNYQIYTSDQAGLPARNYQERSTGGTESEKDEVSSGLPGKLLAEEIEAELYTILDSIDAVVYVADLQTYEILYLNRMGRRLFGDQAGKLCYQHIENNPEGPCPFCASHLLTDQGGATGVHTSEHQNTRNRRWYECRDRAVRWSNGRLVHLQIATDITERKAVEDALRESEYTSRILFEESSEPILLMQESRFLKCNQAALDLLKIADRDELIGLTPVDISPEFQPDGRRSDEAATDYIFRAHAEGHCRFEWTCRRSDGVPVLLEVSLLQILFRGKEMLHATWWDLTDRKKVEQDLKRSETFLNSVIEQSPYPLWVSDSTGTLIRLNQACREMLRITDNDVVGKYNVLHDNIVEEQGFMPLVRRVFESGVPARFPLVYDSADLVDLPLADTVRLILDVSIFPILDQEGRVAHAVIQHNNITEQKRTEEALQQCSASYHCLFNTIRQAVIILDTKGIIIDLNECAAQMNGYDREECIGRSPEFLVAPGTINPEEIFGKTRDVYEGKPQVFEFQGIRKTGESFPVKLFLYKGTFFGDEVVIAVASDVSGEKNTENILLKSEDRFTRINDALLHLGPSYRDNIGILTSLCGLLLDADCVLYNKLQGNLLCVQGEWNAPPDLGRSDLPEGHICNDLIQGEGSGPTVIRNLLESRYAETDPNVTEYGLKTYLGHPVRYGGVNRGSLCAVYTRDCEPTLEDQKIIGILSTAIAQEEEREEARLALSESEERFRLLLQHVPSLAIQGYLLDGTVLYWNSASERMYGYTADEAIGKNLLDLIIPPEMKAQVEESIKTMAETGRETPPSEHYLITKDGIRILVYSNHTIVSRPGKPMELYCIDVDLTERKRVEDALRKANKQINLMTSITRHDIRNRISLILTCLEVMDTEPHDPGMDDVIRKIEDGAIEIQSLIEFTRVYEDLGTHTPQWQKPDLHLPVSCIPETITFTSDLGDIEVYADLMLKKVFFNLLDNSIRHGVNVTEIRVYPLLSHDGLTIVWEDNGAGIAADQKEHIFLRGFGKNTGLGLFLVRDILSLTGISIRETGTAGVGARFEILVPLGLYRHAKDITENSKA